MTPFDPSDIIDQDELAEVLGITSSTLRVMRADPSKHRRADGMPEPVRRVGNAWAWDTGQVLSWWAQSRPRVRAGAGFDPEAEGQVVTVTGITRGARWIVEMEFDARRVAQEWPYVQQWLRTVDQSDVGEDDTLDWMRET